MKFRRAPFFPISADSIGLLAIVFTAAIACLALAGYVLGMPALESINPRWTPMKVVTAVCFLMSAAALLCLREKAPDLKRRLAARALGAAVGVAGILSFVNYLAELHAGRPWLLAQAPFFDLFLAPGARMAVITAALFSLYGCVLFLLAAGGRRSAGAGHALLVPVALSAYLILIGYLFNIPVLYYHMNIGVALNSDIAFFCLCIAGYCIRPRTWLMEVFTSEGAGGTMARRLLPYFLLLPLVIGWLRLKGEQSGLFGSAVGVALVALTYTACFVGILWLNAKAVNRTDLWRRKAEERFAFQAHLLATVHDAVIGLDKDYVINYWNESAERMYGWNPAEALGQKSFKILGTVYIGATREEVAERIRREDRTTYEATHRTKDGRTLNVEVRSALVKDPHGNVAGYISSCRDITGRKRAEEALKKNEVTLRGILDASQESIWLFSRDGRMLLGNPTAIKRFGKPAEDIFGKHFEDILPPDLAHSRLARLNQTVESGKPVEFEDERAGIVFRHSFYPVFDNDGGVQSVACFSRDITERKRTEEALKSAHDDLEAKVAERTAELQKISDLLGAERQRFRDVLDQLPAYVILLTPDYHVAFDNRFFRERFGEHHGRTCHGYLFGRHEPCETCQTYTPLKTGKPHRWEWTGPDKRNYDIYDFPFKDADGSPLIMEVGLDITEIKQVQAALQVERERLRSASLYSRSLIEASLDPLVTISPEGKITDVNDATIKATGALRDKLIGTDFSDYFTEPYKAREGYREAFSKGFVTDYPLTIRHKDGRFTDVLYNASVYRDTNGAVIGVFAAARDVTAKKAAEAELEKHRLHLEELVQVRTGELEKVNVRLQDEIALRKQAAEDLAMSNKDLEQFAYAASHDLQEPLRAIGGFVELLERQLGGSLDAKKKEYMNFIVDGVARMQSLINGLLEYSRVETRGEEPAQTDAHAAFDRARLNLQTAIKESGANVVADALPRVCADTTQLSQLFQNLIGNAIKFRAAAAPIITVSASRDGGAWKFAISDNGIGIEPQYAERIFMIFQRLHTRKKYPGTGIGLAICKRIVERHGGKIWVESKPDNGSTFYFTIPDKGK
jgi:PAS domain S-box-containing protein